MKKPMPDQARRKARKRLRYTRGHQLQMMTLAVERWLQDHEPEQRGAGGELVDISTHGPRVRLTIGDEPYLFDLRRKHVGYRVAAVWREEDPPELVWPVWKGHDGKEEDARA